MTERLRVNEIFYSIQGESTWAGLPCVFIRLTGCNLRCVWCDTAYAFYEGRHQTIDAIVAQVRSYHCNLVEVTGGEPLLQKDVHALFAALLANDYTVMVETSGEQDVSTIDSRVIKIMDLKCPGSGEVERNRWSNVDALTGRDEVKFVLVDRRDYEWARTVIAERDLAQRVNAILLSPVFGALEPAALAAWILADCLPVRMQLQLHKRIWDPTARGV
ncbi:MAG TPA: radical SAM protein [Candidatus Binataceae bacterium]|nr:radical SAM protein [Candidatus Binataceae bacterium]